MKATSISQYIAKQQRLFYLSIISVIFLLTAGVLLFSTHYRIENTVSEQEAGIIHYTEQFFDSYRQRSSVYNQNQEIRSLLRYAADDPEFQADSYDLHLPSDVSLYVDGKLIYPASDASALPAQTLRDADHEMLVYTDSLYYLVPYYNFTQSRQLGLLCYRILPLTLADYFNNAPLSQTAYTLCGEDGTPFYSSDAVSPGLSGYAFPQDGRLFSGTVYLDLNAYYRDSVTFLLILFAGCIAGLVFSSYFSRRLAKRIVLPINQLALSLRHNQEGELTYMPIAPSNLEEIDHISAAYEEMISRIRRLVEQNHKQNLLKAESELKVLQEKINPHFLFNTLELISSQAILEDADKTAQLAQKLGSLFRYSLRMPDILYLKQEIQYAKDYLFLQNVRYNGSIHYEIDADPSLNQLLLPKLTLQPILENCFKHGFANETDRPHSIQIQIYREEDTVVIRVRDDGHGIEAAQAARLNQDIEQDTHDFSHFVQRGEHIGLRNVNARLCSYYRVSAALSLSPGNPSGTAAVIRFPYRPDTHHQGGE